MGGGLWYWVGKPVTPVENEKDLLVVYWEVGPTQVGQLESQRSMGEPWLVWFSGLSVSLCTKRLPVQFPVRAQA